MTIADPQVTARFLGAFIDELTRWGVRDVVVSPGSRSTPLSMVAYELSKREPERLRLIVDVDERGAAFVALGLAKASGRPAAVICTSGSAVANYYPAVMEAESSRVPLVVLTGDRPPQLQGLGAPQTCDQLHAFGSHVRAFRAMPLPAGDEASLRFARQAAREACVDALGFCPAPRTGAHDVTGGGEPVDSARAFVAGEFRLAGACFGGPVHLNFPFDEPLKPDTSLNDLFTGGISDVAALTVGTAPYDPLGDPEGRYGMQRVSDCTVVQIRTTVQSSDADRIARLLASNKSLLLAGEGSCVNVAEARAVAAFAGAYGMPVLADPLSGLRCLDDGCIIANYDSVLEAGGASPAEALNPRVIVRFGRYPISKKATQWAQRLEASGATQIVVDPLQTRDTNAGTSLFVKAQPADFAADMLDCASEWQGAIDSSCLEVWREAEAAAAKRIGAVTAAGEPGESFEGSYVKRVLELAPEGSCLFAANSMSVRAIDTFLGSGIKRVAVLANRGLNGIDGTVSTAIGTALQYGRTTLVTGDLTMLHDLNALALQRELSVQNARVASLQADAGVDGVADPAAAVDAAVAPRAADPAAVAPRVASLQADAGVDGVAASTASLPCSSGITIILLNNNGGAIFDMLPQASDDDYFERLFLTPQDVDFGAACAAFGVPCERVGSLGAFDAAYARSLERSGISVIEVPLPLRGVRERYGRYW